MAHRPCPHGGHARPLRVALAPPPLRRARPLLPRVRACRRVHVRPRQLEPLDELHLKAEAALRGPREPVPACRGLEASDPEALEPECESWPESERESGCECTDLLALILVGE